MRIPTLRTPQFRPTSAHSASAVRAVKKVKLALIKSRPRAFQRAIDKPCTLPLSSPKGCTKRDIAVFASKTQLLCVRKKFATKFLCVKTSSGKVVATYFPYLTVNRSIAGDVPVYLKFALKVTHPQRRFRQISLNSAAAVRAGRGVGYFERKFQGKGVVYLRLWRQKTIESLGYHVTLFAWSYD